MVKSKRKQEKPPSVATGVDEALGRLAQADAVDAGDEMDAIQEARVRLVERDGVGHPLLIYSTVKGMNVDLAYRGGSLWATQDQMADMFGVNVPSISRHLKNIFDEGELDPAATVSIIERVASEGSRQVRRRIETYNLNAIISVGYRVSSKQGTMFRIWATDKLVQILTKGFYVDKERLKNQGEPDVLDEFREIAREIRASIRNSYREVLRLCALCADYDGSSQVAREFFMMMENTLLWAAANKTAPQLVLERCDAGKPDLGLTFFAGKRGPTKKDVVIGNNYLAEGEARTKNRITEMWLSYVEEQLEQGRLPTMGAVRDKLDGFIKFNQWRLLERRGHHKREDATCTPWNSLPSIVRNRWSRRWVRCHFDSRPAHQSIGQVGRRVLPMSLLVLEEFWNLREHKAHWFQSAFGSCNVRNSPLFA